MRKAGGIVALIAGVFGFIAAIITLLFGGLGAALETEKADQVINLGWGGVAFSFLTIVLGAVAIGAKGRVVGVLLVGCAIAGAVLGGTLVAVCMGLAALGGLLAIIDSGHAKPAPPAIKADG